MNTIEKHVVQYRILREHRLSLSLQLTQAKAELEYLKKDKRGYVYFAKRRNGLYKIGLTKTKGLESRILSLSSAAGELLELKHSIHTDDRFYLERCVHYTFKDCRVEGEWFAIDEGSPHFKEWISPEVTEYLFYTDSDLVLAEKKVERLKQEFREIKNLLGESK